jgi:hypothetical protein
MSPKLSQLNQNERAWIESQIDCASQFVSVFSPIQTDAPLSLANLDRAFAAWLATDERDTKIVNSIINCVGITFGQSLVDGAKLRWVIASDDHGTDLAVHGLPGKGDILVYPANFVAKRWERKETFFLESSYSQIEEQTRLIADHHRKVVSTKPWWRFWQR